MSLGFSDSLEAHCCGKCIMQKRGTFKTFAIKVPCKVNASWDVYLQKFVACIGAQRCFGAVEGTNERPSNWRAAVKKCHWYLIKKKPMFSMDYIIPGIDPTGSMTAVQAGRQAGRGGGGGNLLGNIFYPLGVESKGHTILYSLFLFFFNHNFFFYCICLNPPVCFSDINQKTFNHLSYPPQTGIGGGASQGIIANLSHWPLSSLWCTAICVWQSGVFSHHDCPW